MMGNTLELGPDCLWVVTVSDGRTDRRAFYPWDAAELASAHVDEAWLTDALSHLSTIEGEGGLGA